VLSRAADDPAARALVDSGRLAESFWYVDSPLTTLSPTRPFAGRPARGAVPPASPGILVPDAPVSGYTRSSTGIHSRPPLRFREIARDGFLILTGRATDVAAVRATVATMPGPDRVLALPEIDPDGTLTAALGARPDEVWIIRPDAHVAAVLATPTQHAIRAALARATAHFTTREENDHGLLPASR
jgi:3-(3-hydroxy-phenyl)propionate hydroxylase